MLHHSFVFSLVLRFLKKLEEWYLQGTFHKFCSFVGRTLSNWGRGSLLGRLFVREEFPPSLLTRGFCRIFDGWNFLCRRLHSSLLPIVRESLIYRYVENFETLDKSLLSGGITFLIFGVLTIPVSLFSRRFGIAWGFLFLVIGFMMILFASGTRRIFENAKVAPFLRKVAGLFLPDEEVIQ